ncbi:MAG: hypothetical protein ACRDYB_13720, partial [Acidimicrobiales bacterium]
MATGTAMRTNGAKAPDTGHKQAVPAARRRQLPLVVAGVLLVVGCALFFADLSLRSGHGAEMLAVAEPVPAGGVLTEADLRV